MEAGHPEKIHQHDYSVCISKHHSFLTGMGDYLDGMMMAVVPVLSLQISFIICIICILFYLIKILRMKGYKRS
ncbi:hypothetical protein [Bacillus sp. UMB0893]|uniref:hypothetical protein n=1 Tax=Bacillus sp. UMB0893 TaxID=2066053 RepID=UPI000C7620AB|nr:hypothetical protein [Bacillus sp. UMB0893]PLR69054.1 hypothetical protein CYJ36_00900 [Bacillus sp. UMB0893]